MSGLAARGWCPLLLRARFLSGVAISLLGTTLGAYAQQPSGSQEQKTGTEQGQTLQTQKSAETQQTAPEAPATTPAANQTHLPQIVVTAPKSKPRSKPKPSQEALQPTARNAPTPAQAALNAKMQGLDQARDNLLPKIGASTYTITRDAIDDSAARRQHADRQGHPPSAGRVLRFGRLQSEFSRPQRIRQRSDPDQRRHASRGGLGPRPGARHQFHRQHVAADRHAAGPVRAAHRGCSRYHQPEFFGARRRASASTAAAARRSRRASTTAAASATPNISSPRAAIGTASASKIRHRRSTPFTTTPSRASSSATRRPCSTIRPGLA